jgi:3-phosphoshikimate 1-carboxyvinyltransferase
MGALSEKGVNVGGLNLCSLQGDRTVLELLKRFGAKIAIDPDTGSVTVQRGEISPTVIDSAPIPDLIPVLSVLACGAVGDTHIQNAARLRMKESDRLSTTAKLIRDLGGEVEELPDGLIIHGRGALRGGTVDSCNDHRIAMSAAVAACLCSQPVTVRDAQCVQKSYPAFWEDYEGCSK